MAKLRRAGMGPVIVAIPVNNEEAYIGACLEALENQIAGHADHIVLLLNNCTDRTASIAHGFRSRLRSALHIRDIRLPPEHANAGHARRLAMEEAARIAGGRGVLMTTDADGRVDPDWVGANLACLGAGADAVAGWAELDPLDWGAIPYALHADDARECAYDSVCDEIHALLDPDPDDPLPRHTQASGASIAVTASAYRQVGGLPCVASSEDRAFLATLRRNDARIRHAPECRVVVSGRIVGRAAGGMADTIRRRLAEPDRFLDVRLEPAEDCARRASFRQIARQAYKRQDNAEPSWRHLGLSEAAEKLDRRTFGMAWETIEAAMPCLERRRVSVAELPRQQEAAEALRVLARRDPIACRHSLVQSAIAG